MLNRADTDFERQAAACPSFEQQTAAIHPQFVDVHRAWPELTVGEAIDGCICKAERRLKSLRDLKGNLPENFLSAGASRIRGLLET